MQKKSFLLLQRLYVGILITGLLAIDVSVSKSQDNDDQQINQVTTFGLPAQLNIRAVGENAVRITLKPNSFEKEFPETPVLVDRAYSALQISLRKINSVIKRKVGNLSVEVQPNPLSVKVTNSRGELVQQVIFRKNGTVDFPLDEFPVLGMGEGGPNPPDNIDWRNMPIEFDRRGRSHPMHPRWQSNVYGSRNPVAMMIGTRGWGLYFVTPWGEIDLENEEIGTFIPRNRTTLSSEPQTREEQHENRGQGIPPLDSMIPGLFDLFIFDAHSPQQLMKDMATISGHAVMPPKWALGYMQSHRTLEDGDQLVNIVETFREKQIPLDATIYLGTGFTPQGWNKEQPSFEYNPEVFKRTPEEIIKDIHDYNVKFVLHMVPWDRDKLPTLHGSFPPEPDEAVDAGHLKSYWQQFVPLINDGVDAFWPDEGDWFDLFERMKRHQLYYQGHLSTTSNERPWSLHRNGHLGIARWGGWMWSGDPQSTWKTLEGQIAVGINHSLSLSPYWGSDIGGFFPTEELTGELYVRWFQFGAFSPSFRSHGRTWWTRLPWGWGLSERGPLESKSPPKKSAMNNPNIEPIAKKYAELRYRLLPYTYTLTWQARDTGMPLMRAMWLHYPEDEYAYGIGDQYLWGRDMLIAPVYKKDAKFRQVYLPEGQWYDWWTDESHSGNQEISRPVNLSTMPIYVRAGAIIPLDPVRQYVYEPVEKPTTLRIYPGADGEFTLYQDDGKTLDYLEGEYSLTKLTWDDSEQTLSIESANKNSIEKQFRIEVVGKNVTKTITYKGSQKRITMK